MIRTVRIFVSAGVTLVVLGLSLFGISSAFAEEPLKTEAASSSTATEGQPSGEEMRDPEALAELKKATDFLVALPRFHVRTNAFYDVVQEDGRRLQFGKHGDIYLQRPDRLFAESRLDDGRHRQFWYDGKSLAFAERSRNLHTRVEAPPTIDATLDMMEGLFRDPMPLADLLYSDLGFLADLAEEADVVGDSLVAGRPCTHLSFRGETVDWQLWVEQGDKPFIRKVVVTYREKPGEPQYSSTLDDWETPELYSDGLFTFIAPEGSEWINVLVPLPQKTAEGGQP